MCIGSLCLYSYSNSRKQGFSITLLPCHELIVRVCDFGKWICQLWKILSSIALIYYGKEQIFGQNITNNQSMLLIYSNAKNTPDKRVWWTVWYIWLFISFFSAYMTMAWEALVSILPSEIIIFYRIYSYLRKFKFPWIRILYVIWLYLNANY